jgi:hypothetical protein
MAATRDANPRRSGYAIPRLPVARMARSYMPFATCRSGPWPRPGIRIRSIGFMQSRSSCGLRCFACRLH